MMAFTSVAKEKKINLLNNAEEINLYIQIGIA
jgi:hypothetical protein